ncbi:MAG: DUF5685 family protein [Exilispira sp.]
MIGYLKPPIILLYPHEKIFINSAYCTFCKVFQKNNLLFNRLFLSYDSLFFYILFLSSIPSYRFSLNTFFCKYTLTNRFSIEDNGLSSYFAEYSSFLNLLKLYDDIIDEKPIKSKISKFLFNYLAKTIKYIPDAVDQIENMSIHENEIEQLIFLIEKILPLDYINNSFKNSISIIISNLIKLLFYIDAIDDFEEDVKMKKDNILLRKVFLNGSKNIKLKDQRELLEIIRKECLFSINFSINEIDKLPNKDFARIVMVYFTDLIPSLLDKGLIKNNCNPIFYKKI